MKWFTRLMVTPVVPAIIIYLPCPDTADAYLDPGTGSLIIQMAIAGFVGGLVAVKIFWTRIRTFLRNLFSSGPKHEHVND